MWQCLDKIVAIAGGCVVAGHGGLGAVDAGTAIGTAVAAAGMVGFFAERGAKHGPESTAFLAKVQARIVAELGDRPETTDTDAAQIDGWDWSLANALPACMLDRRALAEAVFDGQGFPIAATAIVLDALAAAEPTFAQSPARDFARRVIGAALAAAYEEKAYFESLAPYLWATLGQKVDRIEQNTDQILALLQKMGLTQQAAADGISQERIRTVVLRLADCVDGPSTEEDFVVWVQGWIDAARRAITSHSNEGAAYDAAWQEAMRRFQQGGEAPASEPLMALLERERAGSEQRQLAALDGAITVDLLEVRIDAAVEKLKLIRQICTRDDADALVGKFEDRAIARYQEGEERGSNVALLFAVEAYGQALEECTRERVPLDWARTQVNLGVALRSLGVRESGTARLELAVTAYTPALEELTRERVPLDWAQTQMNLGATLTCLGEREGGTARLEQAVTAFTLALEERTRERVPLDWAQTQMNLGNALAMLGEREGGTARLEQAIAAYTLALEEWTRERAPLDWARTQVNLGNALSMLGERESGTARLELAVTAYSLALEELTRERVPLDWAQTQMNLGVALYRLGQREGGTARFEQAVIAYTLALEEVTPENHAFLWQMIQYNLARAQDLIAQRRG